MQAETNSIAALLSSNIVNNSSTPTLSVTSMVSQPMDIQEINLSSVPNAEVASQSTVAQEINPEVMQPDVPVEDNEVEITNTSVQIANTSIESDAESEMLTPADLVPIYVKSCSR